MKHFSVKTFILLTTVLGLFLVPSFFAAFGLDEGTLGSNFIWIAFAKLFYFLRFPTHVMFLNYLDNKWLYFIGLGINCLFYGLIFERMFHFIKRIKSKFKALEK